MSVKKRFVMFPNNRLLYEIVDYVKQYKKFSVLKIIHEVKK